MTIKSWLFLALLAPLTTVGCAGDEATGDPEASDQADELTGTGPNAWQPQSLGLSCTQGVASKVTRTSRRHVFTFAAEAGEETTFALSGTWPAGYGARIYVTDPAGQVIATTKQDGQSTVTLSASFATTGKHTVSVSPVKYEQVARTYSYKLSASCAPVCDYEQPGKHYVVQSVDKCKLVKYACPAGQTGFGDECGCGCQDVAPVCDYDQPSKHYVAQSPDKCKLVKFACAAGQTPFFDDCGCGCAQ